jgi:hypothetical protein
VLLVAACSSTSAPEVITSPSPEPDVLQAGDQRQVLRPGTYYSPLDFVPPLALKVPAGWSSTQRGDDAFDLARDGVRVVFDTPDGETVAPALARLRADVRGPVPVTGELAGSPASGFDAGSVAGTLLTSPSGTVALDLTAGQRVRVLGTDLDGVPLLVVVVVREPARWSALLPQVQGLLAGVTRG